MRRRVDTFYCFSPLVMITTFLLECGFALYLLMFRTRNTALRITVLLLLALAVFQLAEYGICEDVGFMSTHWAQIGFASVTLLPPLGLHLVYTIAHVRSKIAIPMSYALAASWVAAFLMTHIMESQLCSGNYVIFRISHPVDALYYLYYNVLLALAIFTAWRSGIKQRKKHTKAALYGVIAGYALFIIPSLVVRELVRVSDERGSALPSIMCGFALLLAATLTFYVMPKVSDKKK